MVTARRIRTRKIVDFSRFSALHATVKLQDKKRGASRPEWPYPVGISSGNGVRSVRTGRDCRLRSFATVPYYCRSDRSDPRKPRSRASIVGANEEPDPSGDHASVMTKTR